MCRLCWSQQTCRKVQGKQTDLRLTDQEQCNAFGIAHQEVH